MSMVMTGVTVSYSLHHLPTVVTKFVTLGKTVVFVHKTVRRRRPMRLYVQTDWIMTVMAISIVMTLRIAQFNKHVRVVSL